MSKDKPTTDPQWAESAAPGDVTAPSQATRNAGYPFKSPVPNDEFNEILQRLGRHVDSLNRNSAGFVRPSDAYDFLADGEYARVGEYDGTRSIGRQILTVTYGTNEFPQDLCCDGVYVYVLMEDGTVYQYEADTLTEIATYSISEPSVERIAASQEAVYVSTGGSGNDVKVYILDRDDVSNPATIRFIGSSLSGIPGVLFTGPSNAYLGVSGEGEYVEVLPDGDTNTFSLQTNQEVPTTAHGCADGELVTVVYDDTGNSDYGAATYQQGSLSLQRDLGLSASYLNGAASLFSVASARHHYHLTMTLTGGGDTSIDIIQGTPFGITTGLTTSLDGASSLNTVSNQAFPTSLDTNGKYVAAMADDSSAGGAIMVWEHTNPNTLTYFAIDNELTGDNASVQQPSQLDSLTRLSLGIDGVFIVGENTSTEGVLAKLQLPPPHRVRKDWLPSGKVLHG